MIRLNDRVLAEQVVADLRKGGVTVSDPRSDDPSLHDLYFRMLTGEDR